MAALGGVARVSTLLRAGVSESALRSAVRRRTLFRIRKGWLRTPDAPANVVRCVELGGRLGCISAARYLGLWTPDTANTIHVSLPHHAGRVHGLPMAQATIHWQSAAWRAHASPVETVSAAIRQILLCCDRETAVTIIDSALNKRQLSMHELSWIVGSLPPGFESVLSDVDSASQSGLETLCRWRLARVGLSIRAQVPIDGVGRVDLVIGDRLVIEADGREWHEDPAAFLADRSRDLALISLGYIVLRLAYEHIVHEWQRAELAVMALVGRREHVWSAAHRGEGLCR